MKLVAPSMEKALIKLITTAPPKVSHFALAKVRAEHFGYPATLEAYERIARQAKRHDEIPSWTEIVSDSALSESTRDILADYRKKVVDPSKATVQKFINSLDRYRKMRAVFYTSTDSLLKLKADKVDIDQVIEDQHKGLSQAKATSQQVAKVINYGDKNNSTYLIKDLLKGKRVAAIPTGIKAFDDRNVGIFFKSLMVLGGSSGGGKSAIALTLAKNMAEYGAKVCFVPLEQDEVETNQRLMSSVAEIEMPKMINPSILTLADKKKLKTKYSAFVELMKKKQSRLTVWKPTEDVSMDDVFFHLKPMGYNVIIIDYLSLLAGVGGDDAWQKLGDAARSAKVFADINNCIVILLVQLNDDMTVRYSRAVTEHASLAWYWVRDQKSKDSHIINIMQRKARNQSDHPFSLLEEFQFMRVRDLPEGYTPVVSEQQTSSTKLRRSQKIDHGDYFSDAKKGT